MEAVPIINATGLSKRYGATPALQDVDLRIAAGQVCAVLGPNGAGKSTLIRCALGLERPSGGALQVFGAAPGNQRARLATGVMLQDVELPDLLTGREHLALYASYFDAPEHLATLIEQTDLGAFVDRRYKHLSGGQKRRIQFALALVGRPRLLFLDEPTTGLDTDARNAVWRSVRQLSGQGTTVILTTHYLEEADALADRVVVLGAGRVIADDDAPAIRARVGGALIRCGTRLELPQARALPAVSIARSYGRLIELLSDDAPRTLAALLAQDPAPTELTVRKPSLEEAFAALTRADATRETHR